MLRTSQLPVKDSKKLAMFGQSGMQARFHRKVLLSNCLKSTRLAELRLQQNYGYTFPAHAHSITVINKELLVKYITRIIKTYLTFTFYSLASPALSSSLN